jgi:hypothetical protein
MSLLSATDKDNLPTLNSTEETEDPMVYVKFYNPTGDESVFVTEYDSYDMVFGYRTIAGVDDAEGYFSLIELENQGYAKDEQWEPCLLSAALEDESSVMGADDSTDDTDDTDTTEESVKTIKLKTLF